MILRVEDAAPIKAKAIDSNKYAVDGNLAKSVDNCQLVTVMAPGQMNQLVLRVGSSDTINQMFFAQPPLAIGGITHEITYDHTGSIASDVRNAAVSRPNQLSS